MITYCSISDVKSMKLHSIGIEIFTIEYCLRQPNYVMVSRHLNVYFNADSEQIQTSHNLTYYTTLDAKSHWYHITFIKDVE